MDILTDRSESDDNQRPAFILAVPQKVKELAIRIFGLFDLTEEEQSEAGIYLGGEGRD
jgi:hypothetical protein